MINDYLVFRPEELICFLYLVEMVPMQEQMLSMMRFLYLYISCQSFIFYPEAVGKHPTVIFILVNKSRISTSNIQEVVLKGRNQLKEREKRSAKACEQSKILALGNALVLFGAS